MAASSFLLLPTSSVKFRARNLFTGTNVDRSRVSMSVSVGSRASSSSVGGGGDALFADYKPNVAFLFPGQGAQAVGMGSEAKTVPAAAKLFEKANDILGFDLLDVCLNGPKDRLNSTVISQPAIYVTSLAAGLMIFILYLSFEDGLKLVKLRGEAMQVAFHTRRIPIPLSLSGGAHCNTYFHNILKVRLAVAGAFHTRFMEPAVSRLEAALAATNIRTPRIPVISNVDAQPHSDPESIKKILARQVTSPVQWESTVKTLLDKGLQKSYELGPGKVIAGIVKRMNKTAEIENIGA
ncbi:hypothetical protein QQ045_017015 [Rhodiola kirilowii]